MKTKQIGTKKCELCEQEFEYSKSTKKGLSRKFCSGHCAKVSNGRNNKGRKHSIESSEKKRVASLGEKNHFFGKKHTKDSILKMSESSKWTEEDFRYCNLTKQEKEIMDGLLLGDGCMSEKSRISSRLTFGFKFKETVLDIFSAFPSMNFSPPWQNKTDKCWYGKSNMYSDLLTYNKKWYPVKIKIVPKDIELTSTCCYWWFIGDGYVIGGNVYICTDSFESEDVQMLISKLKINNFNASMTTKRRIRFKKKSSKEFMKWLEVNNNIHKQYQYKWDNFKKQITK